MRRFVLNFLFIINVVLSSNDFSLAHYRDQAEIKEFLLHLAREHGNNGWSVDFKKTGYEGSTSSGESTSEGGDSSEVEIGVAHYRPPGSSPAGLSEVSSPPAPKRVFFLFGLHAREVVSPEAGVGFIEELVKKPLAGFEFMIVVNANPLERERVLSRDDSCHRANANGVDLNRNWYNPFAFARGGRFCDNDLRGNYGYRGSRARARARVCGSRRSMGSFRQH